MLFLFFHPIFKNLYPWATLLYMGIKKGETPFPNLVNLKSNTMKNTLQRYCFFEHLQHVFLKISLFILFS